MKRIVNYFLLVAALLIFQKSGLAQTTLSPLKIYDINPGIEVDSTVSKENKERLFINFKLTDVTIADSVFFMFGTTKGSSDVVTETGNFKKSGSDYVVKTQGPSYTIVNKEASCRIKITKKQLQQATFLSMVVKDKSGLYTNVLSIRLH